MRFDRSVPPATDGPNARGSSVICDLSDTRHRSVWAHLSTSRLAITGGLVLVAGSGLVPLGRSWLAAAGLAPIILAILPCAATCGLGVCLLDVSGPSKPTVLPCSNAASQGVGDTTERADPALIPSIPPPFSRHVEIPLAPMALPNSL